jgi:site-specific DNA-adenine methylase
MNYIGSKQRIFKELSEYFPKHEIYFLFKNYFTYLGKGETIMLSCYNIQSKKEIMMNKIKSIHEKLQNTIISNKDFRDFLKGISLNDEYYKRVFIYCDPPLFRNNE